MGNIIVACFLLTHSIKTVSGKVVAQSIAFRVVSIYWQGVAPFPWYLNAKGPTPLEAPALHTLRLIARRLWRHCVTSLRSAHWLASSLKLAARCPVSGCWPSCSSLLKTVLKCVNILLLCISAIFRLISDCFLWLLEASPSNLTGTLPLDHIGDFTLPGPFFCTPDSRADYRLHRW